jgi:chitinase
MIRLKNPLLASVLAATLLALLSIPLSLYARRATHTTARTHPRLVGYFPQWGLYDHPQYLVKNLITARGAVMLDQLNYAQGFVTNGRCSIADPNADLHYSFSAAQSVDGIADRPTQPLRGNLNQLLKLKRRFPALKLVLSLEGHAADFAHDAQPENRKAFVASCVDLVINGNLAPGVHAPGLFDGIDIDWEYPRDEDAANNLALLTEFRRQFDAVRPGLLLDIAVGSSPHMQGPDMSAISALVDQVGLMTYDYAGPWSKTTGFGAPFSSTADRPIETVQRSVESYLAAGVPASKLIVGVPFYGYGWRLVPEDHDGLFQEGEPIHGDRPYSYIATLIPHSTVHRQPDSEDPWLFDGDAFWTYDDPTSIRHKADYARHQRLGGVMIWELGEDTTTGTLLQSAYEALHNAD